VKIFGPPPPKGMNPMRVPPWMRFPRRRGGTLMVDVPVSLTGAGAIRHYLLKHSVRPDQERQSAMATKILVANRGRSRCASSGRRRIWGSALRPSSTTTRAHGTAYSGARADRRPYLHGARLKRRRPANRMRRHGAVTRIEFGRSQFGSPNFGSRRGGGSPRLERFFSEDAERAAGGEMALDVEGVLDSGVEWTGSAGLIRVI
jgi:hypothetical protein